MATHEAITAAYLRKGFDLGDWRIWPNAGQIEKDGERQHIEPKLVEVLLLLAANPGQVLTRETLLDQAWPRQVVCDEALTRAVSELRTLLGDNNRERRYIRTVPKRGYSLIADVNPLATTTPARGSGWSKRRHRNPWTRRLLQYWLYGTGSLATAFAAVCVLVVALAGEIKVGVARQDDMIPLLAGVGNLVNDLYAADTPVLPRLDRIAVLPFSNLTPDRDLNFFTQGLEEDMRTGLASLPGAQVAGRLVSNQFQSSNNEPVSSTLQAIAGELNVDAIVDGTVRLIDDQIRVTVQVVDIASGFPLWSQRYDRPFDKVLNLQTSIAEDVVGAIHQRLPKQKMALAIKPESQLSKEEELSLPVEEYGHTRHIEWLAR